MCDVHVVVVVVVVVCAITVTVLVVVVVVVMVSAVIVLCVCFVAVVCPLWCAHVNVLLLHTTILWLYPVRPQIVFELSFLPAGIVISLTFCRLPGIN